MPPDDLELFAPAPADDPADYSAADYEVLPREPRRFARVRLRWAVLGFVGLVVVGLTVGILVFNASAPGSARGARTARLAAQQFLTAVNAGNGAAAANLSCDSFADEARAAARSGADPAIVFLLVDVRASKDDAVADITERMRLPGSVQNEPYRLSLLRGANRWLVCGRE